MNATTAPAPATPQQQMVSTARRPELSSPPHLDAAGGYGGNDALGGGGSFEAVVALLDTQQDKIVSLLREERMEAKAERLEAEAKAEQARTEFAKAIAAERQAMQLKLESWQAEAKTEREAFSAQVEQLQAQVDAAVQVRARSEERQLAALQARLESMHGAKLISDDELARIEDAISEFIVEGETARSGASGERANGGPGPIGGGGGEVSKLMMLSERMAGDAAFARQLRRRLA